MIPGSHRPHVVAFAVACFTISGPPTTHGLDFAFVLSRLLDAPALLRTIGCATQAPCFECCGRLVCHGAWGRGTGPPTSTSRRQPRATNIRLRLGLFSVLLDLVCPKQPTSTPDYNLLTCCGRLVCLGASGRGTWPPTSTPRCQTSQNKTTNMIEQWTYTNKRFENHPP